MGKPWYRSRTLWVAAVTFVLGGLNAITGLVSNVTAVSLIAAGIAMLQAFIRFDTSEPIADVGGK